MSYSSHESQIPLLKPEDDDITCGYMVHKYKMGDGKYGPIHCTTIAGDLDFWVGTKEAQLTHKARLFKNTVQGPKWRIRSKNPSCTGAYSVK